MTITLLACVLVCVRVEISLLACVLVEIFLLSHKLCSLLRKVGQGSWEDSGCWRWLNELSRRESCTCLSYFGGCITSRPVRIIWHGPWIA